MQQPMQQQMQSMNGVSMMPTMMNQNMPGMNMNQFNANIPMGSQLPNPMSSMNSMNAMNPMNPMNSMNSMNTMNPMSSMNSMNSMNSMSSMNSMNNMSSMSSMNSLSSMNPMSSMNSMNSMNQMSQMNSMSSMNSLSSLNPMGSIPNMNSMESINPMMSMGSNMNQFPQQMPIGGNQYQFQQQRKLSQGSIQNVQKQKKNLKQMFPNNNASAAVTNPSPNLNPTNLPQQAKKKSSRPSQSKVSIVQPPVPTQPPIAPQPVTNPIPPSGINTPQTPIIPPKFPQQNAQMPLFNENQRLMSSFKRLSNEKSDLFFRLFECNSKKKEERFENFKTQVLVKLTSINPNFPALVHTLVAGIASDYYSKFKDPPLPFIFRRVRWKKPNSESFEIHPTYKFIQLTGSPIDITPTQKEKKLEPRVLASFISFGETAPPTTLAVGEKEIHSIQYGTNDNFYPLIMDEKVPPKFSVQFQSQPFTFLTWLVIQYVELKSAVEVVHELMAQSGLHVDDNNNDQNSATNSSNSLTPMSSTPSFLSLQSNQSGSVSISGTSSSSQLETRIIQKVAPSSKDLAVYARTPMCKGCSFQLYNIVEEIIKSGSAKCPSCGTNIILNDLILEIIEDTIKETTEQESAVNFIDSNSEVWISHMQLADQIYLLMPVHPKEQNLKEELFEGLGFPLEDNAEPFQFSSTKEYLKKTDFSEDIDEFFA